MKIIQQILIVIFVMLLTTTIIIIEINLAAALISISLPLSFIVAISFIFLNSRAVDSVLIPLLETQFSH